MELKLVRDEAKTFPRIDKPEQIAAKRNKTVYRLLLMTVIIMAIPLILEFCILLPLMMLHAITKDGFWALAVTISLTGGVAVIVGLCAMGFILFRGKKYITDVRSKRLKQWVIGLSIGYVIFISMIVISYLRLVHILN